MVIIIKIENIYIQCRRLIGQKSAASSGVMAIIVKIENIYSVGV